MLYLDYQNDKHLHGIVCDVLKSNHLHFLKIQQIDLSIWKTCLFGISSRVEIITSPSLLSLLGLHDCEYPFTKICTVGKTMSSFVSVKPWISIYCIRISFNCSKLLGSEFMLSFSVQILFPILLPRFLNTNDRFKEISLMDLSLAWFAKFNISFLLKRSPEDMLKFIVEQ